MKIARKLGNLSNTFKNIVTMSKIELETCSQATDNVPQILVWSGALHWLLHITGTLLQIHSAILSYSSDDTKTSLQMPGK